MQNKKQLKIAVIGSGISGLSAAYYLSKKNKVDLFEKQDHFGGHSYTVDVEYDEKLKKKIQVDVGFIVFNHQNYPNLINFFKENKIEIEKSNMSFSVMINDKDMEYCGKGLSGFFSNKKNIFNLRFVKMFFEIIKFYNESSKLIDLTQDITLGDYLKKKKLSDFFINYHLIPMVSAIWSMPPYNASRMPMKFFLKFFQNHGLFKIKNRPQWYTVANRSKTYVKTVLSKISGEHFKNYKINKIERFNKNLKIFYGGKNEYFDYEKVVIATHADDALSLISEPTPGEKNILSNFQYKENLAFLHFDENVMPKNKKNWCSWNASVTDDGSKKSSVTYWLNLLQNLKIDKNIFLTLNPIVEINNNKIYKKIKFKHPYYNNQALESQKNLHLIQNKNNILFCGSYFGNGFHEDGITSSIKMLKYLND
jgi:predicted NAD/FAD-binding protein|tara:strand:- start:1209 stop:2474 length:1266 start_codon:yes stop_codon:yes gene_type:complete